MFSLLCLFLVAQSLLAADVDYCKLNCDNYNLHTVCKRKNVRCGAGPACGSQFKQLDIDQNLITKLHNDYRNRVATGKEKRHKQPSASDMNALTYDSQLAYVAQCWTNECTFAHDKCRRTEKYEYAGQNVAILSTTALNSNVTSIIEGMVRDWYEEVKYFNPKNVNRFTEYGSPVTGHYTQMVWAKTKEIGCGLTFYTNGRWNSYLLACNYGPGGNYIGEPVYQIGAPASNCPNGKHKKYPGLCSN